MLLIRLVASVGQRITRKVSFLNILRIATFFSDNHNYMTYFQIKKWNYQKFSHVMFILIIFFHNMSGRRCYLDRTLILVTNIQGNL